MALKVGELFAELGIKDTQFNRTLEGAEKKWNALGGKFDKIGKTMSIGVTAPIVAAGTAVAAMATKTGEMAEQLSNMSASTGLSTDRLQEFKYIADNMGLSFDAIGNASVVVQRKLMGVENDSGMAADAMKRLGISVKDSNGQLLSMDVLFPQIIQKLQGMSNATERNMLASQILGRSFGELAPILSMTAPEFEKASKEARDMGLVLGGEALKNAQAMDDQIDKLKKTFEGTSLQLATAFIPILEKGIIPMLQATADSVKVLAHWFNGLNPVMQQTISIVGGIIAIVGPALLILAKLITAVTTVKSAVLALSLTFGGLGPAIAAALPVIGVVAASLAALYATVKAVQAGLEWLDAREKAKKAKEQSVRGGKIAEDYIKSGDHSIRKSMERSPVKVSQSSPKTSNMEVEQQKTNKILAEQKVQTEKMIQIMMEKLGVYGA